MVWGGVTSGVLVFDFFFFFVVFVVFVVVVWFTAFLCAKVEGRSLVLVVPWFIFYVDGIPSYKILIVKGGVKPYAYR